MALVCTDTGVPQLPVRATVIVRVNDVNERPTAITLTPSAVDENSPVGVVVGTLRTTDVDAGDQFTYALVSSANGRSALSGDVVTVVD